ncbi:MAG: hypothetical protein HQK84_05025 [Nitrospinae bacterium]|nr:hypothetical protein [Nitrospinota bacterium]
MKITGTLILDQDAKYAFVSGGYEEFFVDKILRHTNPHKDKDGKTVYDLQEVSKSVGASKLVEIEEKVLHVNTKVGEYRVKDITENYVVFSRPDYPEQVVYIDGLKKKMLEWNKGVKNPEEMKPEMVTYNKEKDTMSLNLSSDEPIQESAARTVGMQTKTNNRSANIQNVSNSGNSKQPVKNGQNTNNDPKELGSTLSGIKDILKNMAEEKEKAKKAKEPKYTHISQVPADVKSKMSIPELQKIPGFNLFKHLSGD